MEGSVVSSAWLVPFVVLVSILLTRGMIALAQQRRWVVKPKPDRWSQTPTALYGGVAIVGAFAIGAMAALLRLGTPQHYDIFGLFVGGLILFAVGVRDDAHPLNPLVKLVGQILAIMPFLVGAGLAFTSTTFVLSIPLVLFWMLALTNAFNLLDNMDGLSAGTAAIVGTTIGAYALLHHMLLPGVLALLVTGSCLGFLVFNFRIRGPARIFMGDCGSMFLGYILSGLAVIAFCPVAPMSLDLQAAQCMLPVLIMAMPIFDTTLVVIIRKREGRAISQGGRDHSSHRLVYTGRSDKQAVALLYGVSAVAGGAAILLGQLHNSALVLGAVVMEIFLLACLGVYLNRFREPMQAVVRSVGRPAEAENGHRKLVETGSHDDRS
jgi:UDP-GlcNAc:undecaprenyl-phosphate GlcNAc-1-phosphate transferase